MSSVRPVLFVNFSDQPFSAVPYQWGEEMIIDEHCKWDGVPDSFPVHGSRYMEQWRAEHFAKHLINRELDKLKKPINDAKLRSDMIAKCIVDKGQEVESSNITMELMNKNANKPENTEKPSSEITEPKKRGRPSLKKETEAEFPDLK